MRPVSFEAEYASKRVSAEVGVSLIASGAHVAMGMVAVFTVGEGTATPVP